MCLVLSPSLLGLSRPALVRHFGDKSVGAEELRQHVITLLSDYAHLFAAGGDAKQAYEALQGAWSSLKAANIDLSASAGLKHPTALLDLGPGWIDAALERTGRWKANVSKAPQWCNW